MNVIAPVPLPLPSPVLDLSTSPRAVPLTVTPPAGPVGKVCRICSNPAGKHNYYGGQACTSCRAFFRRSVWNGTYPKFRCAHSNSCSINSKSWGSCKACRMRKCFDAGMRPTWVLSESQTTNRNEKRRSMKRERQERKVKLVDQAMQDIASMEELLRIVNQPQEPAINLTEAYVEDLSLYNEALNATYARIPLTVQTLAEMAQFYTQASLSFSTNMADLLQLPKGDSKRLIEENYQHMISFCQSVLLTNAAGEGLPNQSAVKSEDRGREEAFVKEKMKEMRMNPTASLGGISYEQFYASPWAQTREIELRHEEVTLKMGKWPLVNNGNTFCSTEVDQTLVSLLACVLLRSTDGVTGLKEPRKIEEAQERYMTMLQSYLKIKYEESSSRRFAEAIHIIPLAKEASSLSKKRLNQ